MKVQRNCQENISNGQKNKSLSTRSIVRPERRQILFCSELFSPSAPPTAAVGGAIIPPELLFSMSVSLLLLLLLIISNVLCCHYRKRHGESSSALSHAYWGWLAPYVGNHWAEHSLPRSWRSLHLSHCLMKQHIRPTHTYRAHTHLVWIGVRFPLLPLEGACSIAWEPRSFLRPCFKIFKVLICFTPDWMKSQSHIFVVSVLTAAEKHKLQTVFWISPDQARGHRGPGQSHQQPGANKRSVGERLWPCTWQEPVSMRRKWMCCCCCLFFFFTLLIGR